MLAAGAHALLRGGRAHVGARLLAGEDVLELHHAGVGEHQRRVVARHQRRRRHDLVAVLLEEVEVSAADVVDGGHRSAFGKAPAAPAASRSGAGSWGLSVGDRGLGVKRLRRFLPRSQHSAQSSRHLMPESQRRPVQRSGSSASRGDVCRTTLGVSRDHRLAQRLARAGFLARRRPRRAARRPRPAPRRRRPTAPRSAACRRSARRSARMAFSMAAAIFGFSLRNALAFSRPWPMRLPS